MAATKSSAFFKAHRGIAFMFAKDLTIGGLSFLVDFSVFLILINFLDYGPKLAQGSSRTAGALFGLLGHKYFSFARTGNNTSIKPLTIHEIGGYVGIAVAGILLSPFLLDLILLVFPGKIVISKFIVEAIMLCLNFFAMKFVFRGTTKD